MVRGTEQALNYGNLLAHKSFAAQNKIRQQSSLCDLCLVEVGQQGPPTCSCSLKNENKELLSVFIRFGLFFDMSLSREADTQWVETGRLTNHKTKKGTDDDLHAIWNVSSILWFLATWCGAKIRTNLDYGTKSCHDQGGKIQIRSRTTFGLPHRLLAGATAKVVWSRVKYCPVGKLFCFTIKKKNPLPPEQRPGRSAWQKLLLADIRDNQNWFPKCSWYLYSQKDAKARFLR